MRLFSSMRSPTLRRLARALFVIGIIGCAWPEPTVARTDPTLTRGAILLAEREAKRQDLTPEQVSRAEERMRTFETLRLPRAIFVKGFNGLRPVLGGLPGGSGFVFGGGYVNGLNRRAYEFTTNARYSSLGYRQADLNLMFPNLMNPLDEFAVTDTGLAFANLSERYGYAEPGASYEIAWSIYDDADRSVAPLAEAATTTDTLATIPLGTDVNQDLGGDRYLRAEIRTRHADHPAWREPVTVYLRASGDSLTIVGIDRVSAPLEPMR